MAQVLVNDDFPSNSRTFHHTGHIILEINNILIVVSKFMIWHPVHISFPTAYFSSSVALNNKKIWIA